MTSFEESTFHSMKALVPFSATHLSDRWWYVMGTQGLQKYMQIARS
jgi:hypothetical protein